MKDVKKLLKEQGEEILPDKNLKHKIMYDSGVFEEQTCAVGRSGSAAVAVKRRVVTVAAVLAAVAVALTSVLFLFNSKKDTPPYSPAITDFGSVSSATDFYAYGAVSVGGMLDGEGGISLASTLSEGASVSTECLFMTVSTLTDSVLLSANSPVTDDQKSTIDKYALFATGILGGGKITSDCRAADKEGYEYKLDVGYSDGFGGESASILYFNKVEKSKSGKDDENEFSIEGELVTGNASYPVDGKYETKEKGHETENEIEFKAYTSYDRMSYIKMEYEYEVSEDEVEKEVVITVVKNGVPVEKAKISGETEQEKTSFVIEVERDGQDNVSLEFKYADWESQPIMDVKAKFGDEEHQFFMRSNPKENGGGYEYFYDKFEEGSEPDREPDFGPDYEPDREHDSDYIGEYPY